MSLQAFAEAGLWPSLGRTLAAALEDAGIRRPEDVTKENLLRLPGVGLVRADRLRTTFAEAADALDVVVMLVPAGIEARKAGPVVQAIGAGAATVLADDPWRLLEAPGVMPAEADSLARSLGFVGNPESAAMRGRALVTHVLHRAARDGHTALTVDAATEALTSVGVRDVPAAVDAARSAGRAVVRDGLLSTVRLLETESELAQGFARLMALAEPVEVPAAKGSAAAAALESLDSVQQEAVMSALEQGVSVLVGGPGTGKSRTVAAIAACARAAGLSVALAAPTGRAAKRMEELADAPATTLHRLLGSQGAAGGFTRNAEAPLDADLVVVDECSMLDVQLAEALVRACDDGTRLVLVGDPAQLPSIGAGAVLADLVSSGAVHVTALSTLYRQAEGGAIARLAVAVRGGELPADAASSGDKEVVVVAVRSGEEAAHRVVQLVTDAIPRTFGLSAEDVQVVTPVHRGPAGTLALNAALKGRLNPGKGEHFGFDVGDRVVATANHLDDGFANGEVGTVTGVSPKGLVVMFATPVTVPSTSVKDLTLGWAVSVHRAQGSEWPAVVVVLPSEAGSMLSRPLVYTAITRAKRHLSVVTAAGPALARAVAAVGVPERTTRLASLLRAEVDELPG